MRLDYRIKSKAELALLTWIASLLVCMADYVIALIWLDTCDSDAILIRGVACICLMPVLAAVESAFVFFIFRKRFIFPIAYALVCGAMTLFFIAAMSLDISNSRGGSGGEAAGWAYALFFLPSFYAFIVYDFALGTGIAAATSLICSVIAKHNDERDEKMRRWRAEYDMMVSRGMPPMMNMPQGAPQGMPPMMNMSQGAPQGMPPMMNMPQGAPQEMPPMVMDYKECKRRWQAEVDRQIQLRKAENPPRRGVAQIPPEDKNP